MLKEDIIKVHKTHKAYGHRRVAFGNWALITKGP